MVCVSRYEDHHKVHYTDEAITAAVELSARYIGDRFMPDKAIDLIDQAGARVRLDEDYRRDTAPTGGRWQLESEKDNAVADEDYEKAGELVTRSTRGEASGEAGNESTPRDRSAASDRRDVSRQTGIPESEMTQAEKDRGSWTSRRSSTRG